MPTMNIGSTDYTAMNTIDSTNTTATTFKWTVTSVDTDAATGQKEYSWSNSGWTDYLGYYKSIPQFASSVDCKALWTVGQGFKFKGNAVKRIMTQRKIGLGKDSLTAIFYNLDRTGAIAGDCFAEIIKDKKGRLINLKPLNPGTMNIIVNERGGIIRYEQTANLPQGKTIRFDPDEIFHIPFNRIADEVHGISEIDAMEDALLMKKEAMLDLKTVFRRYVKPLIITRVDTDDDVQIAAFKAKLDRAVENGENLIIPSDTVADIDRISIPQFSTLDPLPWIKNLTKEQVLSQRVPSLIMGMGSEEDTEASAKIIYLAFEQYIKFRQMLWEEMVKNQLGLEIDFKFPASIAPSLLEDNKKDGQINKPMNVNPKKHE